MSVLARSMLVATVMMLTLAGCSTTVQRSPSVPISAPSAWTSTNATRPAPAHTQTTGSASIAALSDDLVVIVTLRMTMFRMELMDLSFLPKAQYTAVPPQGTSTPNMGDGFTVVLMDDAGRILIERDLEVTSIRDYGVVEYVDFFLIAHVPYDPRIKQAAVFHKGIRMSGVQPEATLDPQITLIPAILPPSFLVTVDLPGTFVP